MNATDCGFFQNITNATVCGGNEREIETQSSIVVSVLFTISIWTILSNGVLVICFIVSKDIKKNLFNAQILSLSFSDFLVGFSAVLQTLNFQNTRWFSSYGMCVTVVGFYISAQTASFYHIFSICLHRFVTVSFRLKSSRRQEGVTIRSAMIQFFIVWLVALIFAFVPLFVNARWGSTLPVCSLIFLIQDKYKYNLTLVFWNTSTLAPQIVINIMYISIYLKLRHTWVKVETIPNSTQLSTTTSTMPKRSVSEERKLFHGTNVFESKTDNILKVPQPMSLSNSLQQLPSKIMKQEETALPDNRIGINDNTILDCPGNLPPGSRQTTDHDACHKLDSADKSSNKVSFIKGKNVTRQSHGQPLDSQVSRHRHNRTQDSRHRHNRTQDSRHSKMLVTVGLVLLFLDICITPLNILFILEGLQGDFLSRKTKFIIGTLALVNSGINPIIYAIRIEQLRQTIKKGCLVFKNYFVN